MIATSSGLGIQRSFDKLPGIVRFLIVSIGIILVLAVVLFVASMQSNYIFRMWDYWLGISYEARMIGSRSLSGYFRFIGFGPRFVYWETAYRIFSQHPIFGVGLGNYTFHFQDMLPAVQVGYMPELLTRIVPETSRGRLQRIILPDCWQKQASRNRSICHILDILSWRRYIFMVVQLSGRKILGNGSIIRIDRICGGLIFL